MAELEPYAEVIKYRVSMLPEDDPDAWNWDINVEYRGEGRWAVTHGPRLCLSIFGEWEWEPSPSNREDDWLETHRFNRDEALRLAREHAGDITINGKNPEQYAKWREEHPYQH